MGMLIDEGGPAFPSPRIGEDGMSLRDYFAAKAMAAVIANPNALNTRGNALTTLGEMTIPEFAYSFADAMIEARKKGL